MPRKPSLFRSAWAVLQKDAISELRSRYAFSTLAAFALTALSSMSMSVGGAALGSRLSAAVYWVILFFSAMAGLARVFVQEQDAGTLTALKVYALPQAVYFGKMVFNILLLAALSAIVLPMFLMFFGVAAGNLAALAGVTALGVAGIAITSTITAAMAAQAQARSAMFTVLTFPLILPGFLCAIQLTGAIFAGEAPALSYIAFLCGYDVISAVAGSILFDYLWDC